VTESRVHPLTFRQFALAAAFLYFILIGGTSLGTYVTAIAAVNAAIATVLVGLWLIDLPRNNDLTDRLLLLALLAFLLTCVMSAFPRMSFDAATSVTASMAAFGIARGELASMRAERLMITVLALCGLVLGAGFLAAWIPSWVGWWQATGGAPPLDLPLPPGHYRHYHFVAMLLALMLPAVLQLRARRGARPIAVAASLCAIGVVFMSGSRTVWVALLAVAIAAVMLRLRLRAVTVLWTSGLASAVVAGLLLGGVFSNVTSRLLNTFTLAIRTETWSSALGIWLDRPLTGWGPGSFSAVFRFAQDLPTFPDPGGHTHNVVVQVLLESGLIGFAALVAGGAGLMIGAWRHGRPSPYALAGLAIFGLMSLTDLPSSFPVVLLVGIAWAALAAPRSSRSLDLAAPSRTTWRHFVSAAAGSAIVVAVVSTLLARTAFDEARLRLEENDLVGAQRALAVAVVLDPAMALYWRERGTRAAEAGDRDEARIYLEHAQELNSGDATTLRSLAVLAVEGGRFGDAVRLARGAVAIRKEQLQNHLLLAWVAIQAGDELLADQALSDALIRSPWTAAAPSWAEAFGPASISELREAAAAWDAATIDRQRNWEAAWLRAMIGAEPIPTLPPALAAVAAVLRCDMPRASSLLSDAGGSGGDRALLAAKLMLSSLTKDADAYRAAVRVAVLRRSELALPARTDPGPATMFWDYDQDVWLYRTVPLAPAELEPMLPTQAEGLAVWLQDPRQAARRGAPESGLAQCQGSP
jgi:O-antigen ligase/tetratricopeptide (TPR) repeat protein